MQPRPSAWLLAAPPRPKVNCRLLHLLARPSVYCIFGAEAWQHTPPPRHHRASSSASSTRWKTRQARDTFALAAKTSVLKSRAAYKLLELDKRHRLFRSGDTVVDLGFAPGAWSQVAVSRTAPGGRVVGVDVIPAQPPRGASSIQGNFLSAEVQGEVRRYVREWSRGRARAAGTKGIVGETTTTTTTIEDGEELKQRETDAHLVVDVVLSDMSAPWQQTMMNTAGIAFRDHAGSMDLCHAALTFCYDTLRPGGHFVCKFYQGAEDKDLEMRLKKLFDKVVREKPDASRKESKEAYFVAMRRKTAVERTAVLPDVAGDDRASM
ncbi:hypothetical protein ANO11243_000310 [Dothideomycetidae sp. 11243]|nr:hypothetical protein ANO11243_000310 [fungal sp. No.11243]